jgi:hypothetical protein
LADGKNLGAAVGWASVFHRSSGPGSLNLGMVGTGTGVQLVVGGPGATFFFRATSWARIRRWTSPEALLYSVLVYLVVTDRSQTAHCESGRKQVDRNSHDYKALKLTSTV